MTLTEFQTLYQIVFLGTALALFLIERTGLMQREPGTIESRWASNLGLLGIGGILGWLLLPAGLYAFALNQPPGLLARLGLPFAAEVALTFVFLDFWRYWEHRLFHHVPLLWRFHLVHHTDTHVDVTTSERHHPIEVLTATAVAMLLIAGLALGAVAVGLYLLCAIVVTLWSHANLRLPERLDRALRALVVTPAVHALHHSDQRAQTDSNFGTVLTIWDRIFGTYVDPATARVRRFGLDCFHLPQDGALGRVLKQPFLYRRDLGYPERTSATRSASTSRSSVLTPAERTAVAGAVAGSALVSLAMWKTWAQLFGLWTQEAYQYAWLVIPMMAYLIVRRLAQARIQPRPDLSGIGVVVAAALVWIAGTVTNIDFVGQVALVLALQGVAMSALGFASYRRLFPVLVLLFMLVPSGDLLQPILLPLAVKSMQAVATVAGLPHSVDGYVVFVAGRRYIVADECSGLTFVTIAVFLGYCFGLLLYRSFAKVVAFTAFSATLAILCNAVRVNAIVLIDYLRGTQLGASAHTGIQWLTLAALLALLIYVLSRLKGDAMRVDDAAPAREEVPGLRRFSPVLAGALGMLLAWTAVPLSSEEPRSASAEARPGLPPALAGWILTNPGATWSVDAAAGTASLRLTYARDGVEIHVAVVEALNGTAKLPTSRLVWDDGRRWLRQNVAETAICTVGNCVDLVHASWVGDGEVKRHLYYGYSIGSFQTDSRLAIRAWQRWYRLTGTAVSPRVTGLVFHGAALDDSEIAVLFRTLQTALDETLTNTASLNAR